MAIGKGLLKVLSKMGISTIAVLLRRADLRGRGPGPRPHRRALHRHRRRASAAIGLGRAGGEALRRHARATPRTQRRAARSCPWAASTSWRRDGEHHMWDPETVDALQHAARSNDGADRRTSEFAAAGQRGERAQGPAARPAEASTDGRRAVPLEDVEPAKRDRQALRRPAPCRSARSRPRRTRRSRSP